MDRSDWKALFLILGGHLTERTLNTTRFVNNNRGNRVTGDAGPTAGEILVSPIKSKRTRDRANGDWDYSAVVNLLKHINGLRN